MKILHIYKDYYPPVKGGIEGHINMLASGLKQRGCDVEVRDVTAGVTVLLKPCDECGFPRTAMTNDADKWTTARLHVIDCPA